MQLATFELCFHTFHCNEYNWAWLCWSSIIQSQPEIWSNIQNTVCSLELFLQSLVFLSFSLTRIRSFRLVFLFFSIHTYSLYNQKSQTPALFLSDSHIHCTVPHKCTAGFKRVPGEFSFGTEVIIESRWCFFCITNNNHHYICIRSYINSIFDRGSVQRMIISQSTEHLNFKKNFNHLPKPSLKFNTYRRFLICVFYHVLYLFVTDKPWPVSLRYSRQV